MGSKWLNITNSKPCTKLERIGTTWINMTKLLGSTDLNWIGRKHRLYWTYRLHMTLLKCTQNWTRMCFRQHRPKLDWYAMANDLAWLLTVGTELHSTQDWKTAGVSCKSLNFLIPCTVYNTVRSGAARRLAFICLEPKPTFLFWHFTALNKAFEANDENCWAESRSRSGRDFFAQSGAHKKGLAPPSLIITESRNL